MIHEKKSTYLVLRLIYSDCLLFPTDINYLQGLIEINDFNLMPIVI